MKKLLAFMAFLFLPLFFAACDEGETHDPLDTFSAYMESFSALDYSGMYENLDAKSKEAMTEEEYVKIYRDIYDVIPITAVSMENRMEDFDLYKKIEEKDEVKIPVNMSITGNGIDQKFSLDVKLVREKDEVTGKSNFKVSFAYTLVYEGLRKDDKVVIEETEPLRGRVLDRNLIPLADNTELLWIGMVPGKLGKDKNNAIADLSLTYGLTSDFINKRLGLSWAKENTFVDMLKVSIEEKEKVDALIAKHPGIIYRIIKDRTYPYGAAAAHLTGYVGLVNNEEYAEMKPLGFPINSKVGRAGLEMLYEKELRGNKGTQAILVDRDDNLKQVLGPVVSNKGKDIILTIDIEKQQKLFEEMDNEAGTASVVNYRTGEIEALVSSPSYDPNQFILGQTQATYDALVNSPNNPMLNRFTKLYVPGSTIKPITTALALELINFDENFETNITGLYWQKDASWGNYSVRRISEPGNPVNLSKAFLYSDNTYFAQMALAMGESNFIVGAKKYGIGTEMNLGFAFETSQMVSGEVMNSEILLADSGYGQGQVLFNSLTLPRAFSVFVSGGNLVELKLFKDEEAPKTTATVSVVIADKVFSLMKESIDNDRGTAHGAAIEGRVLAGKTGTAEVGSGKSKKEIGWFSVIDKSEEFPYIVTMMIEGVQGRGGSDITVEKVRSFLESYPQ